MFKRGISDTQAVMIGGICLVLFVLVQFWVAGAFSR